MYCEKCKLNVAGNAETCPLCGEKLVGEPMGENLFPTVERVRLLKKLSLTSVYLAILILASIGAIVACTVMGYALWCLPPIILGFLGYMVIKGVIAGRGHIGSKIFFTFALVIALVVAIQLLTPETNWAYTYAIPIMLLIAAIATGVLALSAPKSPGTYVLYMLIIALFGFLPIFIHLGEGEENLMPSIICATGCGTVLIMVLSCRFNMLKSEIVRKFDT